MRHNDRELASLTLRYAGRVNVFGGEFQLAEVGKDYEVLSIRVTASEPAALNLGTQTRTYKLTP